MQGVEFVWEGELRQMSNRLRFSQVILKYFPILYKTKKSKPVSLTWKRLGLKQGELLSATPAQCKKTAKVGISQGEIFWIRS